MMKKLLALILSVLLIFGTAAVAFAADGAPAATGDDTKIYFDAASSGWTSFDQIAFHIWSIDDPDFTAAEWGGKKQHGTNEGDGIWSYDLTKLGGIKPEYQYAVIFYAKKSGSTAQQTYNLLFGTPCLGKTAACDETIYENPEDSNKTTQAAFWGGGIDPAVYGPELKISSIGNVVGTCCPASTTPYQMFEDFLVNTLDNARTFSDKTDQVLIDDVAAALGLNKGEVADAITESAAETEWDAELSELPFIPLVDGAPMRVPYTVDVTRGAGTAVGDKDILVINYTVAPDYQYDTVTLTATPSEGYVFVSWEIKGSYLIEGDATLKSPVLTVKAHDGIAAHARFAPEGAFVRGDADMDGDVTIMDATRIQRYLAELSTEEEIDKNAADADGDNDVTIMDATRIQRVIAELCDMDGNPIGSGDPGVIPLPPTEPYELPALK